MRAASPLVYGRGGADPVGLDALVFGERPIDEMSRYLCLSLVDVEPADARRPEHHIVRLSQVALLSCWPDSVAASSR